MYTKNKAPDFSLPTVMANESKDFVFLLEFAAVPQDLQAPVSFPVVSAMVRYNIVDGRAVEEVVELVVECVPASAHVDLNVREDVLVNFYRVKGAEILKEASELAERRQFEQARTCLDAGAKELRASLVNSHALVLALIRDLEDAKNRVRDDTAWRMGGAAQVQSAFSNHYGQSASSNVQYYAQPQQAAYNMQFQAYQNSRKP
jgi:predicted HTH domain antitoxin